MKNMSLKNRVLFATPALVLMIINQVSHNRLFAVAAIAYLAIGSGVIILYKKVKKK